MPGVGHDIGIDLDTVADELYGALPSEFTSRRDALAAEARRAGDRALAAEVKKLRRPTTGAWLANLLVRDRRDEVVQLLDLGAALRQAQATLATGDLRRLSQERHRLLTELQKAAGRLADRNGQAVSAAAAQELSDTLEAATADPDAAEALRAGRLTTGLHYSGLARAWSPSPAATVGLTAPLMKALTQRPLLTRTSRQVVNAVAILHPRGAQQRLRPH